MKSQRSWTQRFMEGVQLAGESLPHQPLVELCGDRRLLIENHKGVTAYGPELIQVRVNYGAITVAGTHLRLCRMQGKTLVIVGTINEISVVRGRKL